MRSRVGDIDTKLGFLAIRLSKELCSDEQLPMAEVMYPITAGSGHAGSHQTPNIQQGNYVLGFFKDGFEAQQPVIMGVLGNNAQTALEGKDPEKGFEQEVDIKEKCSCRYCTERSNIISKQSAIR